MFAVAGYHAVVYDAFITSCARWDTFSKHVLVLCPTISSLPCIDEKTHNPSVMQEISRLSETFPGIYHLFYSLY